MKKDFELEIFIDKLAEAESLSDDHVSSHQRTITAMRLCLDYSRTSPELLDSCSLQDLEWAFNSLLFWPSAETSMELDDWDHEGIQYMQIYDFINSLSREESIQRKVTFI